MSNFGSFRYFQTYLSLSSRYFKNYHDIKFLFHCYILIPRKCPCKTQVQHTVGGGDHTLYPIPVPTALGAMPGLTSCQRKTIVRSSNPNNIMTKPWIFSLKLILFCSLKISVSQEEKERKEDSFQHSLFSICLWLWQHERQGPC